MSDENISWNDLKKQNVKKRIFYLKRDKELYDARMNGVRHMFKPQSEIGKTLRKIMDAVKRIEDTSFELSMENMEMVDALKEGLMSIEKRLEKLEKLDEYR